MQAIVKQNLYKNSYRLVRNCHARHVSGVLQTQFSSICDPTQNEIIAYRIHALTAPYRHFTTSPVYFDKTSKPSSKVEVTVQDLKKKKEEASKEAILPTQAAPKAVEKKSLKQKIVDELVHYYHGFRLLGIDMKISAGLLWRVLNGNSLTRREYRLLIRTVGDMFRLVPFSVFIVVPFMEFLLPVFIKFFPGMLPSTFQTKRDKEDKLKQSLKVKLDMAKFLQETLDDMAVVSKDHHSVAAKEFALWINKMRTSGGHKTGCPTNSFSLKPL